MNKRAPIEYPSTEGEQNHGWLAWAVDRTLGLWHWPALENKLVLAGFVVFVLGVCLARAYAGLGRIEAYPWDTFSFLDGAWRIANKQIPYRDYFESLGPIIFIQTLFGLVLSQGRAVGFAYSHALASAVFGVWAYALSARRMAHIPRVLLCVSLVLLAVAPFVVGESPARITAASVHNRYGYVLTALVLLEAFCASRNPTRRSELLGGFSTGTALALALFVKVSYFLVGGFVLVGLLACRRQTLRRWIGMAVGSAWVFLAFWIFLGYTFTPMLRDMRAISGAKHFEVHWPLLDSAAQSAAPLLVYSFLAMALLWSERANDSAGDAARKIGILCLVTSTVGSVCLMTNTQGGRMPLNVVTAIIVMQVVGSRFTTAPDFQKVVRCGLILCGSLFVFSQIALDLAGTAWAVVGKVRAEGSELEPFHSPLLAGFRAKDSYYVEFVNDGLDLLGKYRRPNDTIMTLDFSNPFPFALGMKPPMGGITCMKYRSTFDDTHFPSAARSFGQASLVMLPKQFTDSLLKAPVPLLYGPYLESHFHLIAETSRWQLFRHND